MSDHLRVTAIQSKLSWQDSATNRKRFAALLRGAEETDVFVLPEMFNTGFSMETASLSEPMEGPTHAWMKRMSDEVNAVVCGSLIVREEGAVYNRFLWVEPGGRTRHYDKRHRFTMAGEHRHFDAGERRVIVIYKGWKIMLQVCYDLRFPVWSRNTSGYDALIYVANWPAPRTDAWRKLLLARAIENQCYVVGVNRVGKDGNGIDYTGGSAIIDPKGEPIAQADDQKETMIQAVFDRDALASFREKFPVLEDRDNFSINNF